MSEHPEVIGIDKFNLCLYEPLGKLDSYKMSNALYKRLKTYSNFSHMMGHEVTDIISESNYEGSKTNQTLKAVKLSDNKETEVKADEFYVCLGPQTAAFGARTLGLTIPIVPIKGYSFEFKLKSKSR